MAVIYSPNNAHRARRNRRAARHRYHVERWGSGRFLRAGVHHWRWLAIAHAWAASVAEGRRDYRVIDTREDQS